MRAATQSDGKSTSRKSGDNSEEVTPVPISNTEVKLLSADDTWWEAAWESRTLPVFSYLNLGKNERKDWARSVKRMRASFFIALMKDSLLTVFFLYGQNHAFDAWFRKRYTF